MLHRNICVGVPPPKQKKKLFYIFFCLFQEFAEQLVHDAFISASERDVNTGDSIMFYTLTSADIREHSVPLRKD